MAEKIVLSTNMLGEESLALDDDGAAKYEDDADADTTHDCCCPCDPFPECLHGFDDPVVITESVEDWEWPEGVEDATYDCIGPGGDGGDSLAAGGGAGGGGGGARAVTSTARPSDDTVEQIYVNDATNGYATEVIDNVGTTFAKAVAGADGSDSPDGAGGAGGAAAGCVGDLAWSGGDGEAGSDDEYGGAGGGAGGWVEDGVDGGLAEGGRGGLDPFTPSAAGAGGDQDTDAESASGKYGGGGGGGYDTHAGGAGRLGAMLFRAWTPCELQLTFADSLSEDALDCPCEEGSTSSLEYDLVFSEIDGVQFTLTQTAVGSVTFEWEASGLGGASGCEGLESGIRVGHMLICPCEEGDCIETEDWLVRIWVALSCSDGLQVINEVRLYLCSRDRLGSGAWNYYSSYQYGQVEIGDVVQGVVPCTEDTMTTEMKWAVPFVNDCETMDVGWDYDNRHIGTVSAAVVL